MGLGNKSNNEGSGDLCRFVEEEGLGPAQDPPSAFPAAFGPAPNPTPGPDPGLPRVLGLAPSGPAPLPSPQPGPAPALRPLLVCPSAATVARATARRVRCLLRFRRPSLSHAVRALRALRERARERRPAREQQTAGGGRRVPRGGRAARRRRRWPWPRRHRSPDGTSVTAARSRSCRACR